MNQYLARERRYIWDVLYIKCSKCWIEKPVDCFPKHNKWKFWVRNDCKECRNKYHRDFHRANKERLKEYKKKHDENKSLIFGINWDAIHKKTRRMIDKLWARPKECVICWQTAKIIAHHPDYNKTYEIVFCCKSCHRLIHEWLIEVENRHITTLCESEGDVWFIRCERCWTKIKKVSCNKFCKECRALSDKENMKKSHNRHKIKLECGCR